MSFKDWLSWDEAYRQEGERRRDTKFDDLCTYGIQPLDDSLLAIAKNELVVIGADSGVGKSTLILDMARHNAKKGKKVALFYLEGGHIEAIQRMKWRDICEMYFKEKRMHEYVEIDFRKWIMNIGDQSRLNELEVRIYSEQKDTYKNNLFFYPITEGFKINELLESLLGFHSLKPSSGPFDKEGAYDLDLIIIDHLQYFSLDKADNEIVEITKIIREVKKITDHYNIPVILVSHLRKKGKDRGLPDQEDFYGSSNIPKISTTAITIASDTKDDNLSTNIFPTFFRVVKSRSGIRPNYAMRCNFDLTRRCYEDKYNIHKLDGLGNVIDKPLEEIDKPSWAKK
jgi:hypothetical protein